ncbi:hypothetical protein Plhal304r1_c001g0003351 [Plasmopara halstedii]
MVDSPFSLFSLVRNLEFCPHGFEIEWVKSLQAINGSRDSRARESVELHYAKNDSCVNHQRTYETIKPAREIPVAPPSSINSSTHVVCAKDSTQDSFEVFL